MPLELYFHPLSSFCQKVLIALYENDTPFERHVVDLGDEASRAAFLKVWQIGKFPVLRDPERGETIPESSIIIEYLAHRHPGRTALVPADPEAAWQTRLRDRFFDLHVDVPMQKIVTDRLRPPGRNDPHGVEHARAQLRTALDLVDRDMAGRVWATGDGFGMADCAAAPALFFADIVAPFGATHPNAAAYLARLARRPSVARTFAEAQPYLAMMPK